MQNEVSGIYNVEQNTKNEPFMDLKRVYNKRKKKKENKMNKSFFSQCTASKPFAPLHSINVFGVCR